MVSGETRLWVLVPLRKFAIGPRHGLLELFYATLEWSTFCVSGTSDQPRLLVGSECFQRCVPERFSESLPILRLDHEGGTYPDRRSLGQLAELVP